MEAHGIQFSQMEICFNKDFTFSLEISNNNVDQSLFFKIKTTKLKTYDVKPPLGSIPPSHKKSVEFKL